MSDLSSEEIVSDSFENKNDDSFSTSKEELSSDDNNIKITPDNKFNNESVLIKTTRKKKTQVIASDSEDDQLEPLADDSYRQFKFHPIGRSSVLPQTKKIYENMQSPEKRVIAQSTLTVNIKPKEKKSMEGAKKSTASFNEFKEPEEIIDTSESDIVEVSSDEEIPVCTPKVLKQTTLLNYTSNSNTKERTTTNLGNTHLQTIFGDVDDVINLVSDNLNKMALPIDNALATVVSAGEYKEQGKKVQELFQNFLKAEKAIKTINLENLHDKGELLKSRHKKLKEELDKERIIFSKMSVNNDKPTNPLDWENLQIGSVAVQPKTFGRQALETYNSQKALTMDRLQQLHGSLNAAPDENTCAEPPKKLKVELMPHQRRALAWLIWREKQKPSGGILADDMGLGKTLTMISLILKHKQDQEEENENNGNSSDDEENSERKGYKYKGGTLVVCPASLVQQWEGEVAKHVKKNILAIDLYYGNNREQKAKRLARQDMVITTYGLVKNDSDKNGPLFNVRWRRIILDEAHQIRNHKTQSSVAVCNLSAKSRWALTGTPVHNKELDLYSLLKFLRCSPFDDLAVWKRWIDKKDTGGQQRLNTVIASLLLRRTKEQLHQKGALDCLPQKQWNLITVNFDKDEVNVYQKILLFSKALFSQFLHQRAEKNADRGYGYEPNSGDLNAEYTKMHKMLKMHMNVKEVKQTDILVLLLRLRQICCHPSLITGMLSSEGEYDGLDENERLEELNILDKLQNLNLNDEFDPQKEQQNVAQGLSISEEEVPLAEAVKNILNPSNPVFSKDRKSSKVNAILTRLKDIMCTGDKAIVVSQWPTLLRLIGIHLKEYGIVFDQFDGCLPMLKRQEIVTKFNDPNSKTRVLLLSLTAGGVGLNLVGANHLLLADLHWNPQLEQQAQDRIYRVGQTKSVNIYKFMVVDSIEERIKGLQDKKLEIAENVLTGAKTNRNKLSLDDLRMLFQM